MFHDFGILPDLTDKQILFAGIGNVLHHDDGVGVYVAQGIHENQHIRVINAEVSIENYIGKIISLAPDLVILLDSVVLNRRPGYCRLIPVEKLADFTTNTHNISLGRIMDFIPFPTYIIGIQPAVVSLGEGLSSRVRWKADLLIRKINDCFLANGAGFL